MSSLMNLGPDSSVKMKLGTNYGNFQVCRFSYLKYSITLAPALPTR